MEGLVQGLTGVFQALEQLWSIVPLPTLYLAAMAGVILWGGSLRGRIFQLGAREAMGWGIWVWLAWLAIRLLRLTLVTGWDTLHRLLWYGFYPCMGLRIFLVVWISFASNRRPEDGMLPRWLQGLLIQDLLLAGLVLTNDWPPAGFPDLPQSGPSPGCIYLRFRVLPDPGQLPGPAAAGQRMAGMESLEGKIQLAEPVGSFDHPPALRRIYCRVYPAGSLLFSN